MYVADVFLRDVLAEVAYRVTQTVWIYRCFFVRSLTKLIMYVMDVRLGPFVKAQNVSTYRLSLKRRRTHYIVVLGKAMDIHRTNYSVSKAFLSHELKHQSQSINHAYKHN